MRDNVNFFLNLAIFQNQKSIGPRTLPCMYVCMYVNNLLDL